MPDKKEKGTLKRRDFLKLIGVIGGGAAVSGCWSEPSDEIIPYVIPPDDVIPGIPKWYSSTCTECPAGCGIIVKNMDGRAIKLEGNPLNPVNTGSLCSRGQAFLQGQYNPDRFRSPLYKNDSGKFEPISWEGVENKLSEILKQIKDNDNGSKIVFLTNDINGSLQILVDGWLAALGGGRHITYEPVSYESQKEANKITFGLNKIPSYRIDNAEYVISFGADFLETWQSPVQYSKQFSKMHGFDNNKMGKMIYVSPRCSLTGANSDLWLKIKPGTEINFVLGLVREIINSNLSTNPASSMIRSMVASYDIETVSRTTEIEAETIREIARDFSGSKASLALGTSVNTATSISTKLQVAINLLNYIGGNIDKTINFNSSLSIANASSYEEMESLVDSMNKGNVDLLISYNTNPAYSLPNELGFQSALSKVTTVVSFSSYPDETTALSHYILPDSTNLEKWNDFYPQEGVYGLIQPAMNPIFNTKPIGDVLLSVAKKVGVENVSLNFNNFYDYLRNQWGKIHAENESLKSFESFWEGSLMVGGYYDIKAPNSISLSTEVLNFSFGDSEFANNNDDYYYLIPQPSIKLYDGRGANRPWLQELPDPLTTAVWDSWVDINPETAKKLGIEEGDFIDIEIQGEKLAVQAYPYSGIRKDSLAIALGQGHTNFGRYGNNRGVNIANILPNAKDDLSGGFSWLSTKVKVSKTNKSEKLVKIQYTISQHDREIAQSIPLGEAMNGHDSIQKSNGHSEHASAGEADNGHHGELTMYPAEDYFSYKWGMSIDLSKCVGCGSCVTACYAENNVSFVGKEQVSRGRYMGWIRIERFFEDDNGEFKTKFIPMLCQHCDNAPCEPVCPVYATYHNYEGLNVMVYNRCVGTRYCSNNCTYKVRRFNWFDYKLPEPFNLQLNPDVTVRSKGVMEKCTFCSQRIIAAKDKAKYENRKVWDGEIKPACAQTCPTEAITFGDVKDHENEVYKKSHDSRSYTVLKEINTLPSIKYLKKVEWDKA